MSKIHWKYKGFTLVEAIVVISIMGMMASLIFVNYHDYNKRNQLREGNQLIRSAIVEAQNMALAPKDQTPGVEYYYGVCINENEFLFGGTPDPQHNIQKINIYRFKFNPTTYDWRNPPLAKDVYELIKSYDLPAPVKFLKCESYTLPGWPFTQGEPFAFFFKPASTGTYYPNVGTLGTTYNITNEPIYMGDWVNTKFNTYLSLVDDESQTESTILGAATGQISMGVPPPPPCFAADSNINVLSKNGSIASKRISEVLPGDLVESSDSNEHVMFSEVWSVLDANETKMAEVLNLEIKTKNGYSTSLSLAPEHFLYQSESNGLNNKRKFILKKAKEIKIGDKLFIHNSQNPTSNADSFTEAEVTSITSRQTRVMNILTMNDRVVVNGILASVYSQKPFFCTVATSGPKLLYKLTGPKIPNQLMSLGNKYVEPFVTELSRTFSSYFSTSYPIEKTLTQL